MDRTDELLALYEQADQQDARILASKLYAERIRAETRIVVMRMQNEQERFLRSIWFAPINPKQWRVK